MLQGKLDEQDEDEDDDEVELERKIQVEDEQEEVDSIEEVQHSMLELVELMERDKWHELLELEQL